MKLPIFSIYDWKSIFTKKKDIKSQSSFYPYLGKNLGFSKKNKNENIKTFHSSPKKGIIEQLQQNKKYQLEEIKLDDQFWEKTLNEIISKSKDDPSIKPIKTKLETLAFQRQVMKSYYIKEMENQAYLDTLHIQSNPWSSSHL